MKELKLNEHYYFIHTRKGKFSGFVRAINSPFVDIEITDGRAKMLSSWNDDAVPGETISVRVSFLAWEEGEPPEGYQKPEPEQEEKKTVGTIDCTPSWQHQTKVCIALIRDGGPEARKEAEAELLRLAKMVDDHQEKYKAEHNPAFNLQVSTTERGFDLIEFNDFYDVACSLQKSSLADDEAIWFGPTEANPKMLVPGEGWKEYPIPAGVQCTTRMHLTHWQLRALLPALNKFADTGELV